MKILLQDIFHWPRDPRQQGDVAFLKVWDWQGRSVIRGGAADGTPRPSNDEHPLEKYNERNGAQMAVRAFKDICEKAGPKEPLKRALIRTNDWIRTFHYAGLDLEGSEPGSQLHGLCFGVFEVAPTWTRIFWAGDTQVFVRFKDGRVWMTPDEVKEHDNEMYALVDRFKRQAADELKLDLNTKNKAEEYRIQRQMWRHFYEPLCQARDERINTEYPKGYSLLNGQPWAHERWGLVKFATSQLEVIGAATDGLKQPRDDYAKLSDEQAARRLIESIEANGLEGHAELIGTYEAAQPVGHVRHMEKVGVFVRLG